MLYRLLLLLTLSCIITACAHPVTNAPSASHVALEGEIRSEMGEALSQYVTAQQRLYLSAMPIYYANAGLCPRKYYSPGFTIYSDHDIPQAMQYVARETLNLGREPIIMAVTPVSDAWHKGVRAGDTLMMINGKPTNNAPQARARLKAIKDKKAPVTLGLIRDGHAYMVDITLEPACYYPLKYEAQDHAVNAYATGQIIGVTKGMMDFTNDGELAVVIGHELAHNIMHHIPKGRQNTAITNALAIVIDGLTGSEVLSTPVRQIGYAWQNFIYSPRFETEADYVGLYLLARANYDLTPAAPFWRRMAVHDGHASIATQTDSLGTHPASAKRFIVLQKTEEEIATKRSKNQPLMPNLKGQWQFGKRYSWWDTPDEDPEQVLNP